MTKMPRKAAAVAACLSALAAWGAEHADEAAIVVTADRGVPKESRTAAMFPTNVLDLPQSVSRLTVDALPDRNPASIADLADYAPGVSRRSNYWGVETPTFQLRGFNAGDSTAYYKDGFRYQARGPQSMANVEAIEILRGPVSALYGWSAPGGAVQVETKQPSAVPVREMAARADQWGRRSVTADIGGPVADNMLCRLVASRQEGGSFRDGQSLRQTLLAPSVAWHLEGGRRLSVALEWLDDARTTDYGIPAVGGAPADVPSSRIYTEGWGHQHSRSTRLAAKWSQPAWDGDLDVAWSYYAFDYPEYRDAEPWAVTGTTVNRWYENYRERYRWITGYAEWKREVGHGGTRHRFGVRFETASERRSLRHGELDDYTDIDAYAPAYNQPWAPTAGFSLYDQAWRNRSYAVAAQDEIQYGAWTWLLGLRVSRIMQRFDYADYLPVPGSERQESADTAVAPRIGVTWRAHASLSLYANLASAQDAVLPQSRAFDGGSLAPVTGRQWEVGAKLRPANEAWLASLAFFDIARRNVLTRDPSHAGYSVQTGQQRSTGTELQWQGVLAPHWQATAQATWLHARIEQDNRYAPGNLLPYAARHTASAWLTYGLAALDGRMRLSGGIVHEGERFADFANTVRVPGFTRLDLAASYGGTGWRLAATLENVLDKRYYASGVENRPAVIYPGAPRTLSLSFTQNFR